MNGMSNNDLEITVLELRDLQEAGQAPSLLDVRFPPEHRFCALPGSILIPLPELPGRLDDLDREQDWVVYCHHGIRSLHAVSYMRRAGFTRVTSLAGGVEAWSLQVDSSFPRY